MKKFILPALILPVLAAAPSAVADVQGDYVEVRSCDVYTGPCFANAEMGSSGKEGMLVWRISEGAWKGVRISGLTVIAVVRADQTLGDLKYQPHQGDAVILVDDKASASQRQALESFALAASGSLIRKVVEVKALPMTVSIGDCSKAGCASVKAGNDVEITTRCLGDKDHVCGNEYLFYPPLTEIRGAHAALAEIAAFRGKALDLTWQLAGQRGVYLGQFSVPSPEKSEISLSR